MPNAALADAIPKKGFAYSSLILILFTLNTIYGGVRLQAAPPFSILSQFYFAGIPKARNDAKT